MANSVHRTALALTLLLLGLAAVECQRPGKPKGSSKATTPFKAPAPAKDDDLTDECPEPNGYFADGYQCDKYYECVDGAITEKLCPDGMVFNDYNTQVEKCDLPFNIDCTTRSELQTPKPALHCPRLNGYFAHEEPNVCDKFYFCVDGKFNMIVCPDGLVYNERTGICTWPDEAKKKGCSSQGPSGIAPADKRQLSESDLAAARRAKRYLVREYSSESSEPRQEEQYSEEDENFKFKDQAELEKVVEEGYGKDYEDGMWENPNAPPSAEEIPEDYDSADYEDKRAEEDSGSAADTSASVEYSASLDDSPDFVDSVEPPGDGGAKNFLFSVGSIFGDRMLLDEDGFPMFDNKYGSSDLRSVWAKREGKQQVNFKDYGSYFETEARTSTPQLVLTTTSSPAAHAQVSVNSTSNSTTNNTATERLGTTAEQGGNTTDVFKFSCPEVGASEAQQHPRYADPEDCQFFYVCIDGKIPRRNGCKRGQVFNEVSKNCDWPRNVNECKDWYKGILTDAELEALENPRPKNRTTEYQDQASRRRGAANRRPILDE